MLYKRRYRSNENEKNNRVGVSCGVVSLYIYFGRKIEFRFSDSLQKLKAYISVDIQAFAC